MYIETKERLEINNCPSTIKLVQKLWEYILLISSKLDSHGVQIHHLTITIDSESIKLENINQTADSGFKISLKESSSEIYKPIQSGIHVLEKTNALTIFSSKILLGKYILLEGEYESDNTFIAPFGTVFWKEFFIKNSDDIAKFVAYRSRESLNSDINNTYVFGRKQDKLLSAASF